MKPKGSIFERIACKKDHVHVKKGTKKCPTTWWARVIHVDPETGKQHDRQRRADNKAAAIDARNKLVAEIEATAGRSIGTERMTFADLCDYFETHYLKEAEYVDGRKVSGLRSLATVKTQLQTLKDHFGQRHLRSLTYGAIRDFRGVRLSVKTRHDQQRSITSVNRELALLRRMLNIAEDERWVIKTPFRKGLISIADEKKRERIITRDEEKALLAACDAPKRGHLKPIIIAALDTGCRLGELLKLRWRDVDLDNGQITLIAFNTKTATARTVAITTRLKLELERLKADAPDDPRMRVFGIVSNVKSAFTGARNDAGLSDLRFHDLRHSAATRLVGAHIPLAEVGRILGHSQPSTTYRYVNADMETARRAAAALDNFHAIPEETANAPDLVN
ncbi:MAG TPA: site-specific integrase [Pyrinomonadaceae bacterium]|jgi:integrase